jgi:hypothetical protein
MGADVGGWGDAGARGRKWPPLGNVVVLEARHVLAAVKAAADRIPLMQLLNFQALPLPSSL